MAKVKVRLLKPLNGREIGSEVEYDQAHIKRLVGLGAVEVLKTPAKGKRSATRKAEPKPLNKMEEPPLNKADGSDDSLPDGGEKPAEGEQQG
jgi:hypothetical protein